jgi:hypothetical protein
MPWMLLLSRLPGSLQGWEHGEALVLALLVDERLVLQNGAKGGGGKRRGELGRTSANTQRNFSFPLLAKDCSHLEQHRPLCL